MDIIISNLNALTTHEELQQHLNEIIQDVEFTLIEHHRHNTACRFAKVKLKYDDNVEEFIAAIKLSKLGSQTLSARPFRQRNLAHDQRAPGSDELIWFGPEKRIQERRALVKNVIIL